jgi:hypothetical protein
MRSQSEVKKRLRQILWKYLRLRYAKHLSRRPENCRFYLVRQRKAAEAVAFCIFRGSDQGDLCLFEDVPEQCPNFKFRKTKEEVKADFMLDLTRSEFKRHNFKDIVQLEWILEMNNEAGDVESQLMDEFLIWLEKKYKPRGIRGWLKSLFRRGH